MTDFVRQIPSVASSGAPAWVKYNEKTLLAWKGQGDDKAIYWATSSTLKPDSNTNEYTWTPQQQIDGVRTSERPALANLDGTVFLVWKGQDDQTVWMSKLQSDGSWVKETQLTVVGGTSDVPALSVTGSKLYMAWKAGKGDSRVFWSVSDDGSIWNPQTPISGAATDLGPALASDGRGAMYAAWKQADQPFMMWAKCSDGKTWSAPMRGPGGATAGGPSLVDDGKTGKWMAWQGQAGYGANTSPEIPAFLAPVTFFTSLEDEGNNVWGPAVIYPILNQSTRPTLLSTGADRFGIMLACGQGSNDVNSLFYTPLLRPKQNLKFFLTAMHVSMMRTGHAGLKDGSDTVYVTMGVKIKGKDPTIQTFSMGNLTGGAYQVPILIEDILVEDYDMLYVSYTAINSSAGQSAATTFLESAASKILDLGEKADEQAIQSLTGLPLTQLTSQEAGALIGAQIGAYVGGIGVVIGAIAGWLADDLGGFLFPNCDGPVAAALYTFGATNIRYTLEQSESHNQSDDNPGSNSASGCGDNSDYQIIWGFN